MLAELLDAIGVQHYTEKSTLRIEDAIRIHTARLNKQFEQRVNEEVRRRIAEADDAAREQNKELRKEVAFLQKIVDQRGVFTKAQFRQMQMLLPSRTILPAHNCEQSFRKFLSRAKGNSSREQFDDENDDRQRQIDPHHPCQDAQVRFDLVEVVHPINPAFLRMTTVDVTTAPMPNISVTTA